MKNYLYTFRYMVAVIISTLNISTHTETITGYIPKVAPIYILRVLFPTTVKKVPTISGYYKGYSLKFNSNYCILPEDQVRTYFPIVITQEVKQVSEGNNVKYLERISGKPCKLFHVRRTDAKKWSIELELEKNLPLRLPAEAFILLMNPDHIENLKKSPKSNTQDDTSITLPHIVVKPTVTMQQLTAESNDSLLAAFDSKSVHWPVKEAVVQQGSVVLSMRTGT